MRRIVHGFIALAAAVFVTTGAAEAQQPPPFSVVAPGEAVVTGFSGAPPPVSIAPGEDPGAKTMIDLAGPSARVLDLRRIAGPPVGQFVDIPKPFTFAARDVGQVFGVVLDDQVPPNIYLAATSAYGLPIVAPGSTGAWVHVRAGAPGARFMPGLWGPQGGPGTIYRIDGISAKVSVFADVTTEGRPNSGAALGALAYDAHSKSLYASDRESGLIHRFSLSGSDLGVYDHGAAGLGAQGLPPVAWNPQTPLDPTAATFDSGDPDAWGYAAPARRVFALAVHEGRLYYSVADSLRVWSVSLREDGGFGGDAVIELQAPPAAGPTEIASIAFDHQGRMLLAERAAPTGSMTFEPLAAPGVGRVLRFAIVGQAPGPRRVWQEVPDEYAIGFPGALRNADGGVAEGPNYDRFGAIYAGSCGGFLWGTGEDLRNSPIPRPPGGWPRAARSMSMGFKAKASGSTGRVMFRPGKVTTSATATAPGRFPAMAGWARWPSASRARRRRSRPSMRRRRPLRHPLFRPRARDRLARRRRARSSRRRRLRRFGVARRTRFAVAATENRAASRPANGQTSRSAASAVRRRLWPPTPPVRIRLVPPGKRRSAPAIIAATTATSIPARTAPRPAARPRWSTANALRRRPAVRPPPAARIARRAVLRVMSTPAAFAVSRARRLRRASAARRARRRAALTTANAWSWFRSNQDRPAAGRG